MHQLKIWPPGHVFHPTSLHSVEMLWNKFRISIGIEQVQKVLGKGSSEELSLQSKEGVTVSAATGQFRLAIQCKCSSSLHYAQDL